MILFANDWYINSFFKYKNNIFGQNFSDTKIRFDGKKWLPESDFLNFLNPMSGVFVDGNKIIGVCADTGFSSPGKQTQYLTYIDNLNLVKGKIYNDIDSNCTLGSNDLPMKGSYLYNKSVNIFSDINGNIENYLPEGTYTFKKRNLPVLRHWTTPSCQADSVILSVSDTGKNNFFTFAMKRKPNVPDLASYINASRGSRAAHGFNEQYSVSCINMGSINSDAFYIYIIPIILLTKNFHLLLIQ